MGDQVIYLEKFIEYSGPMPAELNRILKTIKELDVKSEELGAQIQDNFEALLTKVPGKTPAEEIATLRKRIEEDQALLIQWAEEKVQLALTGHELLDSQMAQLENDLAAFREELGEQGIEVDNGYGVDDYAMEVAPPEPAGRRTGGSRMAFAGGYDTLEPQMSLDPGRGAGGGGRKVTQIPLSLSRQQSGYGSEGYGTGADVIAWDQPKRGGNRRSSAADGYGSRRRAASAAVHANVAAEAALDEEDPYASAPALGPDGLPINQPVAMPDPFVPGLAPASKEPQAPGRPLREEDIGPGLIGRIAEVFWPDETNPMNSLWYLVKVDSVNLQQMTASIMYQNGEVEQALSLLEVARDQHMMLLNMAS